jgi:hypothetical protein
VRARRDLCVPEGTVLGCVFSSLFFSLRVLLHRHRHVLPLAVVRFLVADLELQQAVDFPVEHGALSAFRRVLTGHAPMSRPL